jgi:hypothetical protein
MGKIQDDGYDVLNVLEFKVTRKCQLVMSIYPTRRLLLYCKDTDSVIYEKLVEGIDSIKMTTWLGEWIQYK